MFLRTQLVKEMWKKKSVASLLMLVLFYRVNIAAQDAVPSQEIINERIGQMFKADLMIGAGTTPEGYRFTMGKVYYSLEDENEVRKYGERAIGPISHYLTKNDVRAQQLAIRLLVVIGGTKILNILSTVAEKNQSPGIRYSALLFLQPYPWPEVADVVKRIATNDEDAYVKSAAQEIVRKHNQGQ